MALKGIKVLELAGLAPAPFCAMLLTDFGASVIRVDRPGMAMQYDTLGNGKRSIALNLKSEQGVKVFKRLSDQCDVVIDPYRKGVMEKLKLGPSDLMATNERLIYARLTGFGQDGPYANMAGHDINFLSLSGLLSLFGRYKQKPTPPCNFAADFGGGGLMCAFGIIMALLERSTSLKGQIVDASMVEGTAYLGSWFFKSKGVPGLMDQPRGKNLLDTGAHWYDTYETRDGEFMAVGALEPQFYAVLLDKLGLTEDELPQFEFETGRAKLSEIFKSKTRDEWCRVFDGSDACVTPVLGLDEVASHPHNRAQASFALGKDQLLVPKPAPRLSRTPAVSAALLAPNISLGDHTLEILREYGFSSDEVKALVDDNVVQQADRKSKL